MFQIWHISSSDTRVDGCHFHALSYIKQDLAHIVQTQQEDVDKIEGMMEDANNNAKTGLKHIEKAASHQSQCTIS